MHENSTGYTWTGFFSFLFNPRYSARSECYLRNANISNYHLSFDHVLLLYYFIRILDARCTLPIRTGKYANKWNRLALIKFERLQVSRQCSNRFCTLFQKQWFEVYSINRTCRYVTTILAVVCLIFPTGPMCPSIQCSFYERAESRSGIRIKNDREIFTKKKRLEPDKYFIKRSFLGSLEFTRISDVNRP